MEKPALLRVPFLFMLSVLLPCGIALASTRYQEFEYLKFVKDATEFCPEEYYDYIVVGGGTAGCPLAATLSEKYSVLVLERGGSPHENPQVLNQNDIVNNLVEVDDKDSPAQAFTSEDGVPNVRARVLGGGTMINAGFYSRGNEEFYREMGVEWDMDVVKESYEWVEEAIVFRPEINTWQSSVKEALLEAGNGPDNGFTLDHVVGTKLAGSIFDGKGKRHGAVELLNKGNSKNLRVAVHALVERVIFSSSNSPVLSAVGVIYTDSIGRSHGAMLRPKGEVILSAGTIGSPQLLLLSGIGPKPYLSSLNISVLHHQPFVGKFLSDLSRHNLNIVPPFSLQVGGPVVVGITRKGYYIESISGVYSFDSPVKFLLFPYPSPPVNISVLTLFEKLLNPRSVGQLRLASSTEVSILPKVQFNYFSDQEDLDTCVRGMRNLERMMNSNAMDKYKFRDLQGNKSFQFVGLPLPENKSDDAALETFCRESLTTTWHYHGGCAVRKVVDKDFRVIGINSLRVVDGSTFTLSPGTNPQATLMMLGRYVGLKMEEGRKKGLMEVNVRI